MQLLDALTRGLDIFYSSPVTHIDYHTGGVAVHTDNHTFKGAGNSVAAWPCPFPASYVIPVCAPCRCCKVGRLLDTSIDLDIRIYT